MGEPKGSPDPFPIWLSTMKFITKFLKNQVKKIKKEADFILSPFKDIKH